MITRLWGGKKSKGTPSLVPARVCPEPVVIDAEIVESWLDAADSRPNTTWVEIDTVLRELEKHRPIRARRLRTELVWLREQAGILGYGWGTEVTKGWHRQTRRGKAAGGQRDVDALEGMTTDGLF